jgi:hypothetical protein
MSASARLPQAPVRPTNNRPWRFVLLAVSASWLIWWIAVIGGVRIHHTLLTVLQMAGFLAVGVTAVLFTWASGERPAMHNLWRSIVDVRRLSLVGGAAAVLLMPVLTIAAAALAGNASGQAPQSELLAPSAAAPLALLKMYAFGLIIGPIAEELGWRGVALGPLQRRYGALTGAAALGCVHALWHLPLFFFPTGALQALGVLTPEFWRFMADIVLFDLIAAALFNAMRASVLVAILFHCSYNVAATLWNLTPTAAWYREGFIVATVALLILGTRGRLFWAPRT